MRNTFKRLKDNKIAQVVELIGLGLLATTILILLFLGFTYIFVFLIFTVGLAAGVVFAVLIILTMFTALILLIRVLVKDYIERRDKQ